MPQYLTRFAFANAKRVKYYMKVKKREGNSMLWILTGTLIVQNIIYTALLRRRKDEYERQKAIAAAWMNAAWAAAAGARTDL